MTTAANLSPMIGGQIVGNSANFVEVASATSGYVPLIKPGTIQQIDTPLGSSEVIRLSVATSTAITTGNIVSWNDAYQLIINPTTQYTGAPIAFSIASIPLNSTYLQYAWFTISGVALVFSDASIAADTAIGISGSNAGKGAASGTGRQIIGAIVRTAATKTVAKYASQKTGSPIIKVNNTAGWFIGMNLSGTGVVAGSHVTAIDSDDQSVTMSANANNNAGYNLVTGTYNNGSSNYWNTVACNRPAVQGAIT